MIEAVIRRYTANCQPSLVEPLGSAGGMSGAQFWRITAPRGSLALRRWPIEHPSPDRLRFIHAVLTHAESRRITFVPVPIATCDGQSFIHHAGHLWELAPWMPGAADYAESPNVEKLRAAMTALARFHIAVADCQLSVALPLAERTNAVHRHLSRLREISRNRAPRLSGAITDQTWPDLAPLARQFVGALRPAVARAIDELEPLVGAPLPLQPCVRDIWHDHVLFSGDEVSGLIDFGAVDIDTPATDVARLLGSLVGEDASGWEVGLGAYSAVRALSDSEMRAVLALDLSGTVLAGCNWIRWIYVEGREFENRGQVIERFRRILVRVKAIGDRL